MKAMIWSKESSGSIVDTHLSDEQVDELDKIANERGISRAALLRQFIWAGYRVESTVDFDIDTENGSITEDSDPYKSIFAEHLPDSKENAIAIEELKEQITSDVKNEVMKLYRKYEHIEIEDGKIYEAK